MPEVSAVWAARGSVRPNSSLVGVAGCARAESKGGRQRAPASACWAFYWSRPDPTRYPRDRQCYGRADGAHQGPPQHVPLRERDDGSRHSQDPHARLPDVPGADVPLTADSGSASGRRWQGSGDETQTWRGRAYIGKVGRPKIRHKFVRAPLDPARARVACNGALDACVRICE